MKGLILIFVLLSGISSAIAQEKLWLDKNYQWTDDSIQAVRYALVSKINKKCIKVEEYALERIRARLCVMVCTRHESFVVLFNQITHDQFSACIYIHTGVFRST